MATHMTEVIKNAKAVMANANRAYSSANPIYMLSALEAQHFAILIDHAEALEKQRDAVLGEEGREFCRILRVNGSNDAADFIERLASVIAAKDEELAKNHLFLQELRAECKSSFDALAALTALPEDVEGLCGRLDRLADRPHGTSHAFAHRAAAEAAAALRAYAARTLSGEAQKGGEK